MKTKLMPELFFIFVFLLASCTPETSILPTQTSVPTQLPIAFPTQTAIPTLVIWPSPTVLPPTPTAYPTASTVKANAVAFISPDEHLNYSLWIANIDGSGERKLVENLDDKRWNTHGYAALRWSPNGKWISYLSSEELWIVSPDGLVNKKVLSFPDKDKGTVYMYQWSPDSSQIAYVQAGLAAGLESNVPIVVGLLDLETGKTSELFSYKSPTPVTFLWAPNGRYLLLSVMGKNGFSIFDIAARKFVKEIESTASCSPWHHGVAWSPNSNWFYDIPSQNGRFATTQICVAGLDGLHRQIDINGTATSYPVWDKTGDFLYFVASNTNFSITPIPDYDLRLMRYDVKTQKLERILSLGKEPKRWSVSISPDGNTLMLQSESSQTKLDLIFVDIQSLTIKKSNVDFGALPVEYPEIKTCGWSSDNKDIIFFFTKLYWINKTWGSVHYGYFYALDIRTGKISVFSGIHRAESAQVSPITTIP